MLNQSAKKIYPVRSLARAKSTSPKDLGEATSNGIYLIGIKGTGMSSLAVLLKKMGHQVTGSDTSEKFFTESQLKKNKIGYFEGFSEKNISRTKPDLVIASTAYNERNPEFSQAKNSGLKLISYPEAVGEISKKLISVAVCGSHGKTTTTSMLGAVMQANGRTATLTGTVADNLNIRLNRPKFFVFEADEYQNKFQYYLPANLIVTNVDFDHPDFFKDKSHYAKTFKDFIGRTLKNKGLVLFNADDAETKKLFKKQRGNFFSFGFSPKSDFQIKNLNSELNHFSVFRENKKILELKLAVYGRHNILNATAAAIMARQLGISKNVIEKKLYEFRGVKRRMEIVPSKKYIIIDDYGHHPTEIAATLSALRNKYPNKKIVTVFHPHTFTRTKALLKEFGKSFKDSDLTLVLDIYPSARETFGGIHSKELVKEISKNNSKANYCPTITQAAGYITKKIKRGTIILTIGAGDVWKLCDLIK